VQEIVFCNNNNYNHQFYVSSLPTDADGIIGMDFLSVVNAKLDLTTYELSVLKHSSFDHGPSNREAQEASGMANRLALTVFSNLDGHESRHIPLPKVRGDNAPRMESRPQPHRVSLLEVESWIVKDSETIKIVPRVKQRSLFVAFSPRFLCCRLSLTGSHVW
jgi:hypothetical protein